MDEIKLIAFCIIFGGGMLWNAIRKSRRARLVADTPRSKTATAPQGFVELEGFAWPCDKTMISNSGLEAVYYTLKVQKLVSTGSGKNKRTTWTTVYTLNHCPLFYLADATGLVTIDPSKAELNLNTVTTRNWGAIPKADQERLIGLVGNQISGFPPKTGLFALFSSSFRAIENELPVGCQVYASGDFRSITGEEVKVKAEGMTDFAKKVFEMSSRGLKNVSRILDKNGDGKVSAEEARTGYTDAAKIARAKAKLAGSVEQEFALHGSLGGSTSHALFIADTSEEHLKSRLKKWLWLQFIAGAGGVTAGIGLAIALYLPDIQGKAGANRSAASISKSELAMQMNTLHNSCSRGLAEACVLLLNRQEEFKLSKQYVDFYKLNLESAKLRHAK